jgi:[ribosomal protein S5]-alanine N-acetyltransferase
MNITLVYPTLNFVEEIQRCASESSVSATCNVPHPYPTTGALDWMERIVRSMREKKSAVFLVLTDGAFSGVVSLNRLNTETGTAELDYWIAGEFQGKGIGTEAVRLVMKKATDDYGVKVLFSACLITNPASSRILEKNGFRETGRFVNDGQFGQKFFGRQMRRLRKDLSMLSQELADPYPTTE